MSLRRVTSVQSISFMSVLFLDSSLRTRFSTVVKLCACKTTSSLIWQNKRQADLEMKGSVWCQSKNQSRFRAQDKLYYSLQKCHWMQCRTSKCLLSLHKAEAAARLLHALSAGLKQLFCIASQRPNICYDISPRHGADLLIQHLQYISAGRSQRGQRSIVPLQKPHRW